MPKIFKTLATITVWTLWVCGWIAFLFPFISGGIVKGYLTDVTSAPMGYFISYIIAVGLAFAFGFMLLVGRSLRGKP